jgi:hypothetical protein
MCGMLKNGFDDIKNKVALRKYYNANNYQYEVLDYLIKFFSYPGASVEGDVFEIYGCDPCKRGSTPNIEHISKSKIEKVKYIGTINRKTVYVIPIVLDSQNLSKIFLFFPRPVFSYVKKV